MGEDAFLLCKGEWFQFHFMINWTWKFSIHLFSLFLSLPPLLPFSCPVAGGEGDISWQKDGEDIEDEEGKVSVLRNDETSSKLTIKNVTMEDAGRYTCVCDYDAGYKDDTYKQLFVYGTLLNLSSATDRF